MVVYEGARSNPLGETSLLAILAGSALAIAGIAYAIRKSPAAVVPQLPVTTTTTGAYVPKTVQLLVAAPATVNVGDSLVAMLALSSVVTGYTSSISGAAMGATPIALSSSKSVYPTQTDTWKATQPGTVTLTYSPVFAAGVTATAASISFTITVVAAPAANA